MSEKFKRGDDSDIPIKNCERYFEVMQASPHVRQYTVLVYKDLQEEFEIVDEKIKGFEDRLRKEFSST